MAATNSLDDLIGEAQVLLDRLGDSANPAIRELRKKIETSIEEMQEQAGRKLKVSAETVREVTGAVVEYVRANPWVAVAASTGIAVALIYIAFARGDRQER